MQDSVTQHNLEFHAYPVIMRSGTLYGPFSFFNTAVPEGCGRRDKCWKLWYQNTHTHTTTDHVTLNSGHVLVADWAVQPMYSPSHNITTVFQHHSNYTQVSSICCSFSSIFS